MRRRAREAAGVAALVAAGVLLPVGPAHAATTVLVSNNQFSPQDARVGLGTQVEFVFTEGSHSATSDDGFWDTGVQGGGTTILVSFDSAGTFGYFCSVHGASMSGSVGVRPTASGSAETGWRLRWAAATAPDDRDYDVQVRRKGAEKWRALRTDTTDATGRFHPRRTARWQVRARTTTTATGATSGWSPVVRLR